MTSEQIEIAIGRGGKRIVTSIPEKKRRGRPPKKMTEGSKGSCPRNNSGKKHGKSSEYSQKTVLKAASKEEIKENEESCEEVISPIKEGRASNNSRK